MLSSVHVVLCTPSAPIVYVAGDGTGDFNCSGANAQIQINQALQFVADNPAYTTVHLKGPFTYVINDTILIGSNTILEGDPTVVIKLADHSGWPTKEPLIQQKSNSGNDNIIVRGFEVNGNYAGNSEITLGRDYYNAIYFNNSNNIKVYDMYIHDGMGDGLRINESENVQFYNNTIYELGHDGLFSIGCENVEAWNNRITCRTNSGLRIWNSNKVRFHDNIIDSFYNWSAGGPGIQIEKSSGVMDSIEINNNIIHNTYGPGIWIFNYDNSSATQDQGKNVHIHHNVFYDTGTNPSITWVGGIVVSGFHDTIIENNLFDGVYHAAISIMYPDGDYPSGYSPQGNKYDTTVRNNIIVNTQKRTKDPNGTGYAVINYLPETHTVIMESNCLYNNAGGNYINASSTTDIYADPLFADPKNHDYHLKSKAGRWDGSDWVGDDISSPCIDAGDPSSDYSNEPEPSGNRINVGPDGNTMYASKSGLYLSGDSSDNNIDSSNGGSSHSIGGSGGGAGGSPEPQSNVETEEISHAFITSGKPVKFDFKMNATSVVYASFDAKKTAGKTTTIIEMLKGKSTLVSELPSNEVYRYLNIWVGNGGFGDSNNIGNAVVDFKVEKSWMQNQKIDQSSITLTRYNDNKWDQMSTSLSGEDDTYLYFIAKTSGFSPFAITGRTAEKESVDENQSKTNTQGLEQNIVSTATNNENTQNSNTSGKDSTKTPGFEMVYGLIGLFAVFLHQRK